VQECASMTVMTRGSGKSAEAHEHLRSVHQL